MLCFVVVMQSFIMISHEVFIHIHQGCFAGTGAIVRLPQCQWSKPDGYGKISQCITTTKHSKAKTVCIFLGIYGINVILLNITMLSWGTSYQIWVYSKEQTEGSAKQKCPFRAINGWGYIIPKPSSITEVHQKSTYVFSLNRTITKYHKLL